MSGSGGQLFVLFVGAALIVFGALFQPAHACTCMREHPQTHFCRADFVILATVKRQRVFKTESIYKIRIRKEYKMSDKALVALKSGRIQTARDESVCGVKLAVGQTYAISGQINTLKAYVSLCSLHEPWRNLTRRQRKGFKMMYKHGCTCTIKNNRYRQSADVCVSNSACYNNHGICLRSRSNQCMWTRSKDLTACLKPKLEDLGNSLTISRWSG